MTGRRFPAAGSAAAGGSEGAIYTFRKPARATSVVFAVSYDDGRTAYLWLDDHGKGSNDHLVASIARERQEQGSLPAGKITGIKRAR